jgi:hypothetical protein
MVEFTECASVSVSYDATGKASISMTVVRDDMSNLQGDYTNLTLGGVRFDLGVMSVSQQIIMGSGDWAQWSLQLEGVGN